MSFGHRKSQLMEVSPAQSCHLRYVCCDSRQAGLRERSAVAVVVVAAAARFSIWI